MDQEERDRHLEGGREAVLTQGGEGDMRHILDGMVWVAADDGSHPQGHGVEGYLHPNLTHVQTMGLKWATMTERNIPVVAKTDECVVKHSREPRVILARGTKAPILGEGEVGIVCPCSSENTTMKIILTPK
jgi:hypothetical protein